MTVRVPLKDLQPGDVVQDLIAAGTVDTVREASAGAYRVDFVFGGTITGPGTFTVVTTREQAVDA